MNCDLIVDRLMHGIPEITEEEVGSIKQMVDRILENPSSIQDYDIPIITKIVKICNIIYNNAPNILSPLSDEKYDRLIVLCKKFNIPYPIGAPPIQFNTSDTNLDLEVAQGPKQVLTFVPDHEKMYYFDTLSKNQIPMKEDFLIDSDTSSTEFKKQRTISHSYDMCGTLDKCKFVLNQDAQQVIDDPSVRILERDFIGKHIQMGIIDPNNITLILSLKYDGISVEATIKGDKIISACTRGDLEGDKAADLTPVLGGLTFPRATNKVHQDEIFGVKFEMIINYHNLERVQYESGKNYVNPRNAVIGLLGRLDSRLYRDFLTPVPLESTIKMEFDKPLNQNYPRVLELDFLNTYYTKGIDMKYTVVQGNLAEVMYKVKQFVQEADKLREFLNFQYDGIVVEYADPHIREVLGKTRSIPNYAIAVKFPPMRRESTFTHYTYSVGQGGQITPKAHFLPVNFMGQIHDKTTVHSLRRFKELKLRAGDKVELSLNNDVIVYLSKPKEQQSNNNQYEEFPTHCPSCGSQIIISSSGDSAYCPNFMCPERCIGRLSNFLAKLNLKGVSTETIRALGVYKLLDLINLSVDTMQNVLGPVKGAYLRSILDNELLSYTYDDYRLLGALGFTNLAATTWKVILQHISIEKILNGSDDEIRLLQTVSGIGPKTIEIILAERKYFSEEIAYILQNIKYNKTSTNVQSKGQVCFSGIRDEKLAELFAANGYDVALDGGVTNKCSILIIPFTTYDSTKVIKAITLINKRLSSILPGKEVNNVSTAQAVAKEYQISPLILTVAEAYTYINNV